MKKLYLLILYVLFFTIAAKSGFSQTHWKGTSNTNWNNPSNWTGVVPTSTTDVVIGDASFTGSYQPTVNIASS